MDPQQPKFDPNTRVSNDLSVMQPGEKVIATVKRHPIGIIGIYVSVTLVLTLAAVVAFGLVPNYVGVNSNDAKAAATAFFFVFASVSIVYALIATKVYWGNSWVITSDSITQVNQVSLFSRQSSQLSLANLEDVTAEQNGILAHIFNYGLLKAETAGEHSKFTFGFCPNPNLYAQQILHAREAFEQGHEAETNNSPNINTQSEPVTNPEPPQQGPGFSSNI